MKRDFTVETYDEFCNMIEQTTDSMWDGIKDWFGDRYFDLKHWLSDLGLIDYTNNMETYYRELLDRKNASISTITTIFENVSNLDTAFSNEQPGHFGYCKEQLEVYREYIASLTQITTKACVVVADGGNLSDFFNPTNIQQIMDPVAAKLDVMLDTSYHFTSDSFSDVPEAYKQEYIETYEEYHLEQGQLLDSVLSDPDLTEQEKLDIKFLIYSAPEPYRSIYIEHLDKYNVVVFQPGSEDSDGNRGSCYWSHTGKVYLTDYEETFVDNPRGPYNTFFHECGHALDDYELESGYMLSRDYNYNDNRLHNYIVDDVRNHVNDYIDKKYPELNDEQKQQLLKSLNLTNDASFDYQGAVLENDALNIYRNEIISHMYEDLDGPVHEAASDVYGGVTNNAIIGLYGHRKKEDQNGENYKYWYNADGSATGAQESELWAEFFAAQMTRDEEALTSIKEHFPTAYEAMEEMAREMVAE